VNEINGTELNCISRTVRSKKTVLPDATAKKQNKGAAKIFQLFFLYIMTCNVILPNNL